MRLRSLRARLTLWYMSLLTVTVLVLGGGAYGLLVYSLTHETDVALHGVATALAEQAQRETTAFVPSDVDAIFQRFFGISPWERYFEMRDPFGRRALRQSPPRTGQLPLSPQAVRNAAAGRPTMETVTGLGSYPVRVLTLPVYEAGRVGRLMQVGMSLESFYVTRHHFLLIMAGVLPLALLLAGGGGWLLARQALAPVDRMAEAARRISAEHLTERLEETSVGDELDRLAATLNAMLGRLDDAFRQIRQFSADASHELQTPVTILKGELEVALRAPRSPEVYQRHLRSALEEVERIARLVDGLLLLARADAGVLRMDHTPVDLAQLVEEVYEQTRVLADVKHVTLDLGPVEPMTVQGDSQRLRQLLLNLVDNGLKYTPCGGRVTLALQHCGPGAVLHVSDTGMGLSPEEQVRVFQRFYRSATARAQGQRGTGLGLCIAQSIAVAHGGRIEVASTPGSCSTFTVWFLIMHKAAAVSTAIRACTIMKAIKEHASSP